TVGAEGGLQRRAVHLLGAVRLLGSQLLDAHGKPAGSGVMTGRPVAQAGFLQTLLDTGEEALGELSEGLGGQFFGAQFNQKILCRRHTASLRLSSTSAG